MSDFVSHSRVVGQWVSARFGAISPTPAAWKTARFVAAIVMAVRVVMEALDPKVAVLTATAPQPPRSENPSPCPRISMCA